MTLTFDDASHTYALNGVVIPHVTGLLHDGCLVDSEWFTEYGRDRGRKVHSAIQLYDEGELDEQTLDPVLKPYVEAWRKFKAEANVSIEASEVRLVSETYGFAGTLDKIAMIGAIPAILDLKTTMVQPWVGIQLAFYHILLNDPARKRYAVQLRDDGNYRLHEFKDRQDRSVALAILTIHNWKRREHGN